MGRRVVPPPPETETAELMRLREDNARQRMLISGLYKNALPVMRDRFLTNLLWGAMPQDEIAGGIALYGLSIDNAPYKSVTVFETDTDPKAMTPPPEHIIRIVNEQLAGRCESEAFIGAMKVVAITAWDTQGFMGELIGIANKICSKCMKMLELKVTAGIGRYYTSADKLHDSFLEAREALEFRSITGSGKAIYIDDVRRGYKPYGSPGGNLFAAVRFGSREQIAMHIADIRLRMLKMEEWERQACVFGLFDEVYQTIERYELFNEKAFMEPLMNRIKPPSVDLGDWFFEICAEMSVHIKSKRGRAPHNLSEEAKYFIDSHFHESGLSVERLCEYLHVSQSYFSTVFKRETGVGYVQYLTELRLARAVALLQQTDDKTYIIANKVGYDDPNYFNYVFKKRFGISPAKYRRSAREL